MDFLRDEDRLRQETVEQMQERIAYDYEQMRDIYSAELGYVPSLYILMHSNTAPLATIRSSATKTGKCSPRCLP